MGPRRREAALPARAWRQTLLGPWLFVWAVTGLGGAARAQSQLTGPVEVPPALEPVDELLRSQLVGWLDERKKMAERHGMESRERYEALDRLDPLGVLSEPLLAFARQHAGSPEALAVLSYIVEWGEGKWPDLADAAWNELLEHHSQEPALGWLCHTAANPHFYATNRKNLQRVLAESRSARVRAAAAFHLAELCDRAHTLRTNLEDVRRAFERAEMFGALPALEAIAGLDREELASDRGRFLQLVKQEYAGERPAACERTFGRLDYRFAEDPAQPTSGERIERMEYSLAHLRPGQLAPHLAATDMSGATFDSRAPRRGPLLILFSFKGCGPCEAFYPTARELAKEYGPQGFEVLAILVDEERESAEELAGSGEIPGRCIWDGRDGRIAETFQATSFPTVFLIDRDGTVVTNSKQRDVLERELAVLCAGEDR